MGRIQLLIFDWGDTVMRDFSEYAGPMVLWPKVEAMPGAEVALAALSATYPCCLASNAGASDAELMGQALERAGLRRHFRHLWTSKELGAAKPDRGFFTAILDRLGLEPAACVMIGNDYVKDIQGAKAAGLRTIWLSGQPAPAADLAIATLYDLPMAVAHLNEEAPQ